MMIEEHKRQVDTRVEKSVGPDSCFVADNGLKCQPFTEGMLAKPLGQRSWNEQKTDKSRLDSLDSPDFFA